MQQLGGNKRLMSDINVTPFVDVMLVLLIIFMVTAPMMLQGVEVTLPKTATKHLKTREDPLVVTVSKKQEIFLENQAIEMKDLEAKIRKIFEYRREKEVLLRADETVPYGLVIKVVSRIKQAGIDKLGMVTEPVE
ncbi:MAG: protein TolR [Deltaproteobacteria bacterium CG_4_8_14_3_um_filter_51_11]|nr:protein TolR [bacterium]OIP41756.1 MAG: protein TolR [Desulfobacteraceae bacterium CG2_30_51_40]PIP45261.1 MAG: protein TolR [Deltaproteobacteria bacterium CG23_combo_of_CG06-09_8_20_14_all_51_20]PIX18829.1 MAG: protein TolR [Deltaproteobacteria bacterium CG_4_8_14_3_um_filter_51_11]PJB37817.1 MAG: protein TolR [Deltaproteobacteria bacterium CG_4_9_14_3_um_filter_51_14]